VASPTSPSGADVPPVLPSIPLAPETARPADSKSIGALVTDVTTQLSNLVQAEVTAEVRKGVTGSVFFTVAAVIGLFSLFYFFFALAELLSLWFLRWVAFAIVFVLMVLVAALFGFLGYRKVRKIRKPERTIESLRESADMLQHLGRSDGPPELDAPSSASAR
jgi:Flp pilus assembly protein TadB